MNFQFEYLNAHIIDDFSSYYGISMLNICEVSKLFSILFNIKPWSKWIQIFFQFWNIWNKYMIDSLGVSFSKTYVCVPLNDMYVYVGVCV